MAAKCFTSFAVIFLFFNADVAQSQPNNPGKFGERFEGDMVLTDPSMISSVSGSHAFRANPKWLWPNGDVYYRLSSIIKKNATKVSMITDAMADITENAPCINFINIEKDNVNVASFVDIVTHGDMEFKVSGLGCQSEVGYQGRRQILNLQPEACFHTPTIKHELFHTLGSVHEHARPDVLQALEIFIKNVRPNMKSNFKLEKYEYDDPEKGIDDFETPYDIESIMQYPPYAFAINESMKTMKAKDPLYRNSFGESEDFSVIDIIEINLSYNCEMTSELVFEYVNAYMNIMNSRRRMDKNRIKNDAKQIEINKVEVEKLNAEIELIKVKTNSFTKVEDEIDQMKLKISKLEVIHTELAQLKVKTKSYEKNQEETNQLHAKVVILEDLNIQHREKINQLELKMSKMGNQMKVDCIWSSWSEYSQCSATTCGPKLDGTKTRTRSIQTQSQHGGAQCTGGASQTVECGCVLLHKNNEYNYFKIPVEVGSNMTSDLVLSTCNQHGMTPQCYHSSPSYSDSNCILSPSSSNNIIEMSKIMCNSSSAGKCPSMNNMFWYMANWNAGSACGVTKGSYCRNGKLLASSSDQQYFASCLQERK